MTFNRLFRGLSLFCLFSTSQILLAQSPPGVEVFAKPEQIQPFSLKLSPTGDYYALIAPRSDRSSLIVLDRASNTLTANITPEKNQYIVDYWWVSGNRLVMTFGEKQGGFDQPFWMGELMGIDADGKNKQYLFGYRGKDNVGTHIKNSAAMNAHAYVLEPLADEKNAILIGIQKWNESYDSAYLDLARLNVKTGALMMGGGKIPLRDLNPDGILVDAQRKVRVVSGALSDRYSKLLYRDLASGEWLTLNDQKESRRAVLPLAFSKDGKSFYVSVSESGTPDYLGLMDPASRQIKKIYTPETADIGRLMRTADRSDAYAVESYDGSGRGGFVFLDKNAPEALLTKKFSAKFQGELAYLSSFSDDGQYASLFVSSDVNPGEYYIYDKRADALSAALPVRAGIDINASAVVEPFEFKARDGQVIRGWVTLPNEPKGPMPLVVMPHGGPYFVVDRWQFNTEAQFLASRGYAVLQVNFRGSSGYGMDFANAGVGEWGGKMQHDVTDGTRAALTKFAIDPKRVCMFGGSYGAYAAMMGAAQEPGLYHCAIGYSGVYDLQIMRDQGDITRSSSGRTYLNDVLSDDKAWLAERSPTKRAAQIKVPVLLIHGGKDERTPPAHAEAMKRALTAAGNPPEWLYVESEGHGFYNTENRIAAYQKILDFLNKHIGPQSK